MLPWSGDQALAETESVICRQIDSGFPVPMLLLRYRDKTFDNYVWHWFLLIGYDTDRNGAFCVNAVTYGSCEWLDLAKLWDTGYERKGGLILFKEKLLQV